MVLTAGDGSTGCLGHGDTESQDTPKLVESLLNADVTQISSAENYVAALTRDGKIYNWGNLPNGEMICSPHELPHVYMNISSIKAGPDAMGAVTSCGKLLVQGINAHNRLGLDQSFLGYKKAVSQINELTHVKSLSKWFVTSVSFGRSHTAVLTQDGYVVTMGSNTECQLGHKQQHPAIVSSMVDRVVTMAVCGPTYTVVGTEENAIYFWGTRFTQGSELVGNESRVSMTTLETQVVSSAQEILALYASEEHISKGLVVTLQSIYPLWHCIFVNIETTAPLPKIDWANSQLVDRAPPEDIDEYDSLGPVPEWIKAELAQATHEWQGELVPSVHTSSSQSRSK